MKLKVKFLKISAGRPVAILHKKFAEKASIHVDERIFIEKNSKKIAAVVDIATGLFKENEIALSTEVINFMKLKENDFVEIKIASKPESLEIIHKKYGGKSLNKEEFKKIMNDIVNNQLTESEIAYFISAVYEKGMSLKETAEMVKAIVSTGKRLDIKGKIVDKHGIGGVSGRTTPIVVSICASTGLIIPKTSSRAITTPAGTADAMEVICKVDFSIREIKKILKKTNACLVWGGSLNMAPADDKIIQVERLINLDPEPQLLASIMAKKLAVNAKYILIDIPYGKNAKVNKKEAKNLAIKFKKLAKYFNVHLECFLRRAEEPTGNGVGPALEIKDIIKVLKREDSCHKLEEYSLQIAGKLLELSGKAQKNKGYKLAKQILDSGQALKKFKEIVKAQKGNLNHIPEAEYKKNILAKKSCKIKEINTQKINELARILGCPADKFAGIYLYKHHNEKVKKGEKILTLFSESNEELKEGIKFYNKNKPLLLK